MPIKNYTTQVSEDQTVSEIMRLLAQKGARQIQVGYDDAGQPDSIAFVIVLRRDSSDQTGVPVPFKLPCNIQGAMRALAQEFRYEAPKQKFLKDPKAQQRARKIAWRIVKDWVDAQVAMVEMDQAALAQVFLPYVVRTDQAGREVTMFEAFLEQTLKTPLLTEAK